MTLRAFLDALCAAGLEPAKELPDDTGRLVRFRVNGDKPGSRNGWFVRHDGPMPSGAFGSWRTGESHNWRGPCERTITHQQRAELERQWREMRRARDEEMLRVRAAAREKAARLWAIARPATDAHPYLQAKGVHAYGIRQLRDMLLVPMRDVHGVLHSLQFISPDGSKRFLTAGRTLACYFSIGRPERELLLGEGLATCSTLYQATGSAVAVCFNCGNLEPVARALRAKFPRLRLVVCADNDRATPGNPGLTHATAAAKAVGAFLAVPRFEDAPA